MKMGQSDSVYDQSQPKIYDDDDLAIQVSINGVLYKVSEDIPADTSLNTFIREVAKLKGTKVMCHEGGCGACIVAAERQGHVMSVNSCLIPIYICDGWKITTVEGLGNRKTGYHTLQAALADMNGSQCGFCSPGWVMNMYSLSKNGEITMKEVENSFAGNLCRCTGYRPILDAFKSFASDAPPSMKNKIKDIEDLYDIKSCKKCTNNVCHGSCKDLEIIYKSSIPRTLSLKLNNSQVVHKSLNIEDVFNIFQSRPSLIYIFNGGNTAHGVYRNEKNDMFIDINDIPDLHRIDKETDSLTLGANVTLSAAKSAFEKYINEPGFEYLKYLAEHIDLVASVPIRNIGTIAGNLMIKNKHNEFPSDIFLILETAGAQLHILDSPGSKTSLPLMDFLKFDMYKKLIYSIVLPSLSPDYVYKSYKIMPRTQNAHALVNAGFLFKMDKSGKILEKPNIIYGGMSPEFLHAVKTEEYLVGKSFLEPSHLKSALELLSSELNPDHVLPDYKPEFRKILALALFYKFVLSSNKNKVSPKLRSGGSLLQRGLSSGRQDYDTDKNLWPLNQPIPKIEAIYQTSGEGEYINDIIIRENEVFCALTIAETVGEIKEIDSQEALSMDGVIAFYTAKHIPGKNAFINSANKYGSELLGEDELLFADKQVLYAGQAYGIIAAKSQDIARLAASKVKLVYTPGPKRKPMITIHDVKNSNDKTRIAKKFNWPATQSPGQNEKHKITGTYECGPQYHFPMETQTCVCVPIEDGMDVFSSTQWMDLTQNNIATVLDVPANRINVKVRRLGGAYGSKISRATQIACACALVSHNLDRPARLVLTIESFMRTQGKRTPAYLEYDLSTDDAGKIQKMNATYWGNVGASFNESHAYGAGTHLHNCYDFSTWTISGYDAKTDVPANTWCRSPGSAEGISMIEHVMEKIARVTKCDPLEVRIQNMNPTDKEILVSMIDELKKTSDYDKRVQNVKQYNKENRWKKRGISLVPMKYPFETYGQFHAMVSVYARDGTVSISHAGIEMGQGIHTKIAQIAAHTLGIDLKLISVKPSNNLTSPNSSVTGGAVASDTCGYATQMACKELLRRLQPIKEKLGENPAWKDLVFKAHAQNVDLNSSFMFTTQQKEVQSYPVYGATVSEVEIDVLTGQHIVLRVDILEDTGVSLSPNIDIGQIEGAFIMGMGYWTCEDLMYDPITGALATDRTWNYKIPGAKDIPVDFRISFRRNAPNPLGILRSKTTGEPPLCMSCSIPIAIRYALNSARSDAGNNDAWYQLDNAVTTEKILLNSLTKVEDMVLTI